MPVCSEPCKGEMRLVSKVYIIRGGPMLRFGSLFFAVLLVAIGGSQEFSQERSFTVGSIAQVADGAMPQMT